MMSLPNQPPSIPTAALSSFLYLAGIQVSTGFGRVTSVSLYTPSSANKGKYLIMLLRGP